MSEHEGWQVVTNKKNKKNTNQVQNNSTEKKSFDPIIARQKETCAKLEAEKQEAKQIKYCEQQNPDQDWKYVSLGNSKPKQKISHPQRETSSIKENVDGDIKIKKVSKSMAKAVIDARMAHRWTQVQLAHNAAVDTKTIGEIERGGCVYNANIFNKLCKTLGVNIERNYDLV